MTLLDGLQQVSKIGTDVYGAVLNAGKPPLGPNTPPAAPAAAPKAATRDWQKYLPWGLGAVVVVVLVLMLRK